MSLFLIDAFQIRSEEGRVDGFSRSNLNDEDKDKGYDDDDIHAAEESLEFLKNLTLARERLATAAEKTATSWPASNSVMIFSVNLSFGLFLWTARHSLNAN
ncbi:hypothetical protein Daus18300_000142 [Diaporthe australafricana]|uniref:Uncharacterized protein n=1 Tax=Diaporthe australafricana TaxID=127596 RepID=A0ABR3Y6V8_9PEZI